MKDWTLTVKTFESMKGKPVTDEQKEFLELLGYKGREPEDRREAWIFIDRLRKNRTKREEPIEQPADFIELKVNEHYWLTVTREEFNRLKKQMDEISQKENLASQPKKESYNAKRRRTEEQLDKIFGGKQ